MPKVKLHLKKIIDNISTLRIGMVNFLSNKKNKSVNMPYMQGLKQLNLQIQIILSIGNFRVYCLC